MLLTAGCQDAFATFRRPSDRELNPWPTTSSIAPSCRSSTATTSDPWMKPMSPGLTPTSRMSSSNTNPDGSFIDRKAFLAQIGRGSSVKNIREHDVLIRIRGDFAIIHARASYQKPDGAEGAGRYTDHWNLRDGRWQCVSAHVTRL